MKKVDRTEMKTGQDEPETGRRSVRLRCLRFFSIFTLTLWIHTTTGKIFGISDIHKVP